MLISIAALFDFPRHQFDVSVHGDIDEEICMQDMEAPPGCESRDTVW